MEYLIVGFSAFVLGLLVRALLQSRHEAGMLVDGRRIQFPHWAQAEIIDLLAPPDLEFVTSVQYRRERKLLVREEDRKRAESLLSEAAKRWMAAHPAWVEQNIR